MLKIGITGNIGSGKSTVCKIFESLGIPLYYADIEARKFYSDKKVIRAVRQLFGDGIFDRNNKLIRAKLAHIVFNDSKKLKLLNAIIHPLVLDDFLAWAEKTGRTDYLVYESALLFESGFNKYFDQCILVTSPQALALQRVMERDAITEEEFKARATKQLPESEKIPLAHQIIINDGKRPLIPQVLSIHNHLKRSN